MVRPGAAKAALPRRHPSHRFGVEEDGFMHDTLLTLYLKLQNLRSNDEGQDLIETALATALIAIVAIATMRKVGSSVNTVFSNISSSLA